MNQQRYSQWHNDIFSFNMIKFTGKTKTIDTTLGTLTLPWEKRVKSRQRVHLDNGKEAGLFLVRGTILRDGEHLVSEEGSIIKICAAIETVSTVYCTDPLLLARTCYHLGNRHVDIEICSSYIRYLDDPVINAMLSSFGLSPQVVQSPFEPEPGAYDNGHPHTHE